MHRERKARRFFSGTGLRVRSATHSAVEQGSSLAFQTRKPSPNLIALMMSRITFWMTSALLSDQPPAIQAMRRQ
jgi:hypothetical protein